MKFEERLDKLEQYSQKAQCVTNAYGETVIHRFVSVESTFREFLSVYSKIRSIDKNAAFMNILRTSDIPVVYDRSFVIPIITNYSTDTEETTIEYAINADGKLCQMGAEDASVKDIITNLIVSDVNKIALLLTNVNSILSRITTTLDKIDEELNRMDAEYSKITPKKEKNLADMFSVDNVAKFSGEENNSIEEVYDEANLPDTIKMRVDVSRIPDMKNRKIKSHYEIVFNNVLNKGINLTFMIEVSKCVKVSDNEIDILLDKDDHYSVYMTSENGSRRKIFTGWELYKFNKEYTMSTVTE